MSRKVSYGLAISDELLGYKSPVLLQGGLEKSIINAADMGFDNVEIHIRKPFNFNPEEVYKKAVENNISISAIGTGLEYSLNSLSLTSDDENIRKEMVIRLKDYVDLAQQFKSVVFLGLCRGMAPNLDKRKEYLDRFEQEIFPIASYAREKGVVLALEPIAFYLTNLLNTTEETLEFLNRDGLGNIQLLLDTHHMYIEDKDIEKSLRMCKGKIAHFHISDSNRKFPGGGNVDYEMIGKVLKDIDYDKMVSLEVLQNPSAEYAAIKGIEWMRSVWGE